MLRGFSLRGVPAADVERLLENRGKLIRSISEDNLATVVLFREIGEPKARPHSSLWIGADRPERAEGALRDVGRLLGRLLPYPRPEIDRIRRDVRELLGTSPGSRISLRDFSKTILVALLQVAVAHKSDDFLYRLINEACGDFVETYYDDAGAKGWVVAMRDVPRPAPQPAAAEEQRSRDRARSSPPRPKRDRSASPKRPADLDRLDAELRARPRYPGQRTPLSVILNGGGLGEQLRTAALAQSKTVLDLLTLDEAGALRIGLGPLAKAAPAPKEIPTAAPANASAPAPKQAPAAVEAEPAKQAAAAEASRRPTASEARTAVKAANQFLTALAASIEAPAPAPAPRPKIRIFGVEIEPQFLTLDAK